MTKASVVEQIRKNRFRQVDKHFLRQVDGTLIDLGYGTGGIGISSDGIAFASTDGIYNNGTDVVHRWLPGAGWEPICQDAGRNLAVSKAPSGQTEVVFDRPPDSVGVVYREGYGPYEIHVTSGLNGAEDVDRWNNDSHGFHNVSLPAIGSSAGFICGKNSVLSGPDWLFILTPMPIQP